MPNITYFTDHSSPLENIKGVMQNAEVVVDFSLANAAAADTVNLMNIPAGAIVNRVNVVVVTAGTTSGTMDIGDGSTAALFDAAIALDAIAGTMTGTSGTEATLVAAGGKYYATAGFIVGTIAAATMITGKYIVSAQYIILNKAHA